MCETLAAQFIAREIILQERCAQIFRNIFRVRMHHCARDSHVDRARRAARERRRTFFLALQKRLFSRRILRF